MGIRDYDETSCNAVEFLKCMTSAGVSIEALIEYMDLFEEGIERLRKKDLAQEQRELVRERIAALQAGLDRLDYKIFITKRSFAKPRRECVAR